MKKQEKTQILRENYQKLDENWKDYFQDLTQNLAKIHKNAKFLTNYRGKSKEGKLGICTP